MEKRAKTLGFKEERREQYILKEIADYVSSGEAFDERGKNVILKNSLEGKTKEGFFQRLFHRPKFDGEKYMDKTMEAFNDLYALFKSGDYTQRMPELTKSVTTLYDLRFLNPAVDILREYNLIDKRKYDFLKNKIYSQVKESSKEVAGGIEKYIIPQKVAAVILGVFGISLIAFSSKITGAFIGIPNVNIISETMGLIMILISLALSFIKKKK